MKAIMIYSGKGGVGKSTTTACLGKKLAEKNKVYILDGDVNTPSMNQFFKEKIDGNLMINSLGFKRKRTIYLEKSALRKYISECINEIEEFKPDYVLIDTPPSLTDVHINLIDKLKISGMIIVTQPSELSKQDINRTAPFFINRNVEIIGLIENMVKDKSLVYDWTKIGKISFVDSFEFEDIYKANEKQYESICKKLKNYEDVIFKNKIKQYTNENIEIEEEDLRRQRTFLNIKTWDKVRENLQHQHSFCSQHDRFLDECTGERIERLIKAFESEDTAYFMVTNSPGTVIKLLPGEIGECSLKIDDRNYGVPKVIYKTRHGEVTLFPYEVKPATMEDLNACLDEGGVIVKDGRYIPNKEIIKQLYNSFGSRIGLTENWEETYDLVLEN